MSKFAFKEFFHESDFSPVWHLLKTCGTSVELNHRLLSLRNKQWGSFVFLRIFKQLETSENILSIQASHITIDWKMKKKYCRHWVNLKHLLSIRAWWPKLATSRLCVDFFFHNNLQIILQNINFQRSMKFKFTSGTGAQRFQHHKHIRTAMDAVGSFQCFVTNTAAEISP